MNNRERLGTNMGKASIISLDEIKVAREGELFRRDTLNAVKLANMLYAEMMNDVCEIHLLWEDSEMYKCTSSECALVGYKRSLKILASLVKSCVVDLRRNIKKLDFLQGTCLNLVTGDLQVRIEKEIYELMEEIEEYEKEYKEISGLWKELR